MRLPRSAKVKRHQSLGIGDAGTLGAIGEDQPLGRRDLAIDAPLGDDGSVGCAHAATPGAARTHIHLATERREIPRRPPARGRAGVDPGREYAHAGCRDVACQDELVGDRSCGNVHGFLWNSASTTISIASPSSGGRPKSTGLMRVRAVMPRRGCPAKPLPAPTSSTSKVIRPCLAHQAERAVDLAAARARLTERRRSERRFGERFRFQEFIARELLAEAFDVGGDRRRLDFGRQRTACGVGGIPIERRAQAIEAEDAVGIADVRHAGDDRGVVGVERVGAGGRLLEVGLAHVDARRQVGRRRLRQAGRRDRRQEQQQQRHAGTFPVAHRLLRRLGYCFSAAALRSARPASKSLPIMVSMSMKRPITLVTKALGP